jgi:hypothetical protein
MIFGDFLVLDGTDREISAVSEHSESATNAVSFPVLIPPKLRKNRFLICLVPREHAAVPDLLPRFDRGGLPSKECLNLWLAEMSQLSGGPFTFLARLACARRRGRYAGVSWFTNAMRTHGVGPLAHQQARGAEVV